MYCQKLLVLYFIYFIHSSFTSFINVLHTCRFIHTYISFNLIGSKIVQAVDSISAALVPDVTSPFLSVNACKRKQPFYMQSICLSSDQWSYPQVEWHSFAWWFNWKATCAIARHQHQKCSYPLNTPMIFLPQFQKDKMSLTFSASLVKAGLWFCLCQTPWLLEYTIENGSACIYVVDH